MLRKHFNRALTLCVLVGMSVLIGPLPAIAGCGCDHPPPAPGDVMPAFGSPGKTLQILDADAGFHAGHTYDVSFQGVAATGTATDSETLRVDVPMGATAGPKAITFEGGGSYSRTLPSSAFTVLDTAPVVAAEGGAFQQLKLHGAVTTDGTLLLPLNVRHVQQGMQLAFQFDNLPLEYSTDDVVMYNVDGVDLTLFTLAVEGQTAMEWGSYFGWEVESDTNLTGAVYDYKVKGSTDKDKTSDVLTYWRHEFVTYTDAHVADGDYAIDEHGYHAAGTLHVNHGHLVVAIHGMIRNGVKTPKPLKAGKLDVDVRVLAVPAEGPIEPQVMLEAIESQTSFTDFEPDEDHFDEFEGM